MTAEVVTPADDSGNLITSSEPTQRDKSAKTITPAPNNCVTVIVTFIVSNHKPLRLFRYFGSGAWL